MKKILITGKDSYIGINFKKYISHFSREYKVDELDMLNDDWINHDFSKYDVVFHVAGLAHSTPSEREREIYYKVNTDLTYKVALKAKNNSVKQFIFMSSIIVYGSGEVGKDRIILKDTPLIPDNFYGDSKKQAEIRIKLLEDANFKIVILRPPMIYGPNSKNNYQLLSKFAKKTLFFPNLDNERSMLYIGNLTQFIKLLIDAGESGVFLPQNKEYVSSKALIKEIAKVHHHKVLFISFFNPLIKLMKRNVSINKVFGNFIIDKSLSNYNQEYCEYSFEESIYLTGEFS